MAHADLSDIAATYAFHIAQAQAYLDGNKRLRLPRLSFFDGNGVVEKSSDMSKFTTP